MGTKKPQQNLTGKRTVVKNQQRKEFAKLIHEVDGDLSVKLDDMIANPLSYSEVERANMLTRLTNAPNIPTKSNKIGRNEKCPCGSGKKYKRCCL